MDGLSTLEVTKFHSDHLVNVIRTTTGSDTRSEIAGRHQVSYVEKYLDALDPETIIFETEYIDRYFLEDHVEYYSRCFNNFPRSCTRLHFFSHKFSQHHLDDGLSDNDPDFLEALQHNYLGFIVVRPVEETFFARICLSPYLKSAGGKLDSRKLLMKPQRTSLAGINLSVESVPLQEQDKVVAACATSAIWSFLNAYGHVSDQQMPSLSSITKLAVPHGLSQIRTIPSQGLDREQISSCLKSYGLEPRGIQRDSVKPQNWESVIKDNVYGFINADVPIMLGGRVYREDESTPGSALRKLGDHLVTVLGFENVRTAGQKKSNEPNILSRAIRHIYVHDDRIGPYAKVEIVDLPLDRLEPGHTGTPKLTQTALKIEYPASPTEYLVPDLVQLALHHKLGCTLMMLKTLQEH